MADLLTRHLRRKFALAESSAAELNAERQQIAVKHLENLFEDIFDIHSLDLLERLIADHLPKNREDGEVAT